MSKFFNTKNLQKILFFYTLIDPLTGQSDNLDVDYPSNLDYQDASNSPYRDHSTKQYDDMDISNNDYYGPEIIDGDSSLIWNKTIDLDLEYTDDEHGNFFRDPLSSSLELKSNLDKYTRYRCNTTNPSLSDQYDATIKLDIIIIDDCSAYIKENLKDFQENYIDQLMALEHIVVRRDLTNDCDPSYEAELERAKQREKNNTKQPDQKSVDSSIDEPVITYSEVYDRPAPNDLELQLNDPKHPNCQSEEIIKTRQDLLIQADDVSIRFLSCRIVDTESEISSNNEFDEIAKCTNEPAGSGKSGRNALVLQIEVYYKNLFNLEPITDRFYEDDVYEKMTNADPNKFGVPLKFDEFDQIRTSLESDVIRFTPREARVINIKDVSVKGQVLLKDENGNIIKYMNENGDTVFQNSNENDDQLLGQAKSSTSIGIILLIPFLGLVIVLLFCCIKNKKYLDCLKYLDRQGDANDNQGEISEKDALKEENRHKRRYPASNFIQMKTTIMDVIRKSSQEKDETKNVRNSSGDRPSITASRPEPSFKNESETPTITVAAPDQSRLMQGHGVVRFFWGNFIEKQKYLKNVFCFSI